MHGPAIFPLGVAYGGPDPKDCMAIRLHGDVERGYIPLDPEVKTIIKVFYRNSYHDLKATLSGEGVGIFRTQSPPPPPPPPPPGYLGH